MDLESALRGRRSAREFTSQPVDEPVLRLLIDAAVQAPSAMDEQPWSFLVIRDTALLDRISRAAKEHMLAHRPAGLRGGRFEEMLSDAAFQIFHQAPVLVVIGAPVAGEWAVEDCALAAENLMLAAFAAGLGTCWIGLAQRFLQSPEGRRMAGIPEAVMPVAPIIVGHPRTPPAPVPRRPPAIRWVG